MKKIFNLAYVGAIALVCAGFSSCADDTIGKEVEPNPTYDAEKGEVTADFVFNVSAGTQGATRMTSANTQANVANSASEQFRGIDHAVLYSFKIRKTDNSGVKDGWHIAYAPTPTPEVKAFQLGTVMTANSIVPAGDGDKPYSHRIIELALPTETNTLLFYGKAIKTDTDAEQGFTEEIINVNGNMNANYFRTKKIVEDGSTQATKLTQAESLIAAVMTKIIRSSYTISGIGATGPDSRTKASGTIKWSDYVTITTDNSNNSVINAITAKTSDPVKADGEAEYGTMSMLGEILANTYLTFNTIYKTATQSELRAGSGPAIKRMMRDLYNVTKTVADAEATSLEELIAKRLAQAILTNINTCFDPTSNFDFRANSALKSFTGFDVGDQANLLNDDANLSDFPKTDFNLPYGATVLTIFYNTTKNAPEYGYMGAVPTYAMGGGTTSSFDPSNYLYAPELMYFGNSPIRVTDESKIASDYPDGTTNWVNNADPAWAGWTNNSHVLSTTRAVAMRNSINYGNALLRLNVKYGTGILKDNNHKIQEDRTGADENDNSIQVTSGQHAGKFILTGVLIGGQPRSVGWNFLPRQYTGEPADIFSYMVYDSVIPDGGTIPGATSTTVGGSTTGDVYTLLWDNWDESLYNQNQRTVYVALEFVNNSGQDFWGMNNLIPNGGTFYITGKLDPDAITVTGKTPAEILADKSLGIEWPATYEMPPYYTTAKATAKSDATLDSKTIKERRVFMQDYVTDVTFVLTENSLKYALVAVPDLRSSQISLGLSVDLHWRQGLNFGEQNLEGGQ